MPAQKPTTIVSGTVDGVKIPADWKTGQYGNYKQCGIKLLNCNKPGISWLNYFWNEKSRSGDEVMNPFDMLVKGQAYNFICTTSVYNEKIQYTPISYERVNTSIADDNATARLSEKTGTQVVDEHDYPTSATDAPIPIEIQKPVFRFISGQVMDKEGNVYEVKA